jgi:hypothetical protein
MASERPNRRPPSLVGLPPNVRRDARGRWRRGRRERSPETAAPHADAAAGASCHSLSRRRQTEAAHPSRACCSGENGVPAAAVGPLENSNAGAPRWGSISSPELSRLCRRNRLKMRLLMRRERCAARKSGQRPGQRPRTDQPVQPLRQRKNPGRSRGSSDGASRTRTGDLLSAIRRDDGRLEASIFGQFPPV